MEHGAGRTSDSFQSNYSPSCADSSLRRNRDGFLDEAELIRPLNTYHNMTSTSSEVISVSPQSDYGQQQPRAAGPVPSPLGSLDGLGRQQGVYPGEDESGRGGGGLLVHKGVRLSPRQRQQVQQQQKQKQQEKSWEDDERLGWD